MAVIESKGDGYSTFGGIKFKNLPPYDTEVYPYAAIISNGSIYSVRITKTPITHNGTALQMEVGEYYRRNYSTTNGWEDSLIHDECTSVSTLDPDFIPVWSNYDIIKTDTDSVMLTASEPIPLDGMNVIEWDGDTTGLANPTRYWYLISDASDVDVSKPAISVNMVGFVSTEYVQNTGYYVCGQARIVTEAGETYPSVGVYGQRRSDTVRLSLFAYIPVEVPETVDYTITYATSHGTVPSDKTVTVNYGESYALTSDDLPALSADGYVFVGWAKDGDVVGVGTTISANTTLTAVWEEIPESIVIDEVSFLAGYLAGARLRRLR